MSLQTFLSKLFGNKSQRDLKEIKPIIDKINAIGPSLKGLTNDELRGKIDEVRASIAAAIKADEDAAAELRLKVEDMPFNERQPVWDEIDKHEKNILDILEDQLNEHLPIVFATMRETGARFAANETIEVTATQLDRDLAAEGREFVSIEGDKAIWKNKWLAGGNESHGTWYTTTCSSSAAWCSIRVKSPRWLPARVRHSWQPSPCSSARFPAKACMW